VTPFVNNVYYDEHLSHFAGTSKGTCIAVADHPSLEFYCTFTVAVEHEGDIAVQGSGSVSLDGSTLLIAAASGTYKGYEGSLLSGPVDDTAAIYKYTFTFHV